MNALKTLRELKQSIRRGDPTIGLFIIGTDQSLLMDAAKSITADFRRITGASS